MTTSTPSSTPLPSTFQQWTTTQSGLDGLKLVTATMPVPKEDEVLVKIHTISLNYRDLEGSPHGPIHFIIFFTSGPAQILIVPSSQAKYSE